MKNVSKPVQTSLAPLTLTISGLKEFNISFSEQGNGYICGYLKNTNISWHFSPFSPNERLDFLSHLVLKILQEHKNKEQQIVIVSHGSGNLLMEYLLFVKMYQMGYKNLHLRLIDLTYKDEEIRTNVLPHFTAKIKEVLGEDSINVSQRIRFFSNMGTYLTKMSSNGIETSLLQEDTNGAIIPIIINPPAVSMSVEMVGRGEDLKTSEIDDYTNFLEITPRFRGNNDEIIDILKLFGGTKRAITFTPYTVGIRILHNSNIELIFSGDMDDALKVKTLLAKNFKSDVYSNLAAKKDRALYLYNLLKDDYTVKPMKELYTSLQDLCNETLKYNKKIEYIMGLVPREDIIKTNSNDNDINSKFILKFKLQPEIFYTKINSESEIELKNNSVGKQKLNKF